MSDKPSRRHIMAATGALGASALLAGSMEAQAASHQTEADLHTNNNSILQ